MVGDRSGLITKGSWTNLVNNPLYLEDMRRECKERHAYLLVFNQELRVWHSDCWDQKAGPFTLALGFYCVKQTRKSRSYSSSEKLYWRHARKRYHYLLELNCPGAHLISLRIKR